MPLTKQEKREYCSGCQDDFYNGNNPMKIKECWCLKTAKLVKRYRIYWWAPIAGQNMGRGNPDIQPERLNNPLSFVPHEDGRAAPLCRICGKPQVPINQRIGWTIKCQHRALLFEEQEQGDLFNGSQKKVKGRMSFFKRLSYQKGQTVAQWEDIIIAGRGCC